MPGSDAAGIAGTRMMRMSWLRLSCTCDVEPCQYGVRKYDKWPVKKERRRCSECPELKGVSMRGSIKALEEIIVRSAVAADRKAHV